MLNLYSRHKTCEVGTGKIQIHSILKYNIYIKITWIIFQIGFPLK